MKHDQSFDFNRDKQKSKNFEISGIILIELWISFEKI